MNSFAPLREGPSQQGQEQRRPIQNSGGQSAHLAEALNQSPRVLAQAKLAAALARRQPRQEVVQRASKDDKDLESKLKEEEKPEIVPSLASQSHILIEETSPEQSGGERAALMRTQELYQILEQRLQKTLLQVDGAMGDLPTAFYMVDEDGRIVVSKDLRHLEGVRQLLAEKRRLESSLLTIGPALALLPTLIAAFEPSEVEGVPKALAEQARIENQLASLRNLRPVLEKRLQDATAEVDKAKPPRKIEAYKRFQQDPVKVKALADAQSKQESAAALLKNLELKEAGLGGQAEENKVIRDQAGSILSQSDGVAAAAQEALFSAQAMIEAFPAFLERLKIQDSALVRQQENQEVVARMSVQLENQIDLYLRFNGSPKEETFSLYKGLYGRVAGLQEKLPRMTFEQILIEIDAVSKDVSLLTKQSATLPPLLPARQELEALKVEKRKEMIAQFEEIDRAAKAAAEVGSKSLGGLQSQLLRQKELKERIKKIDTSLDPRATMEKLDPLLEEQAALDLEVAENPDLKAIVTQSRIEKLRKRYPSYAELIADLLQSGRVLDPKTLLNELARPVAEEKQASRLMELEHLLEAATRRDAFLQVGRMKKEALVAALQEHGLGGTAATVLPATVSEFEADGILYLPDGSIEAVQHKTTTSVNPLEGRTHSSQEKSEPELQKQLKDAANQLSGLTAQGSERDIYSNIPETPPPGAKRIANLRFQKVFLPGHEELQEYNAVISSVLGSTQRQSKGPRWQYVEEVILNFRDGRVVYKLQSEGKYQGSFEPGETSNLKPYTFNLDAQ